jgi:hypothetical protein
MAHRFFGFITAGRQVQSGGVMAGFTKASTTRNIQIKVVELTLFLFEDFR